MRMSLLAPSASCDELAGQVGADLADRCGQDVAPPGVTPDAPEASSSTVSLVDMQPSESTRSKVTRVAARRASSSSAGVGDGVGGEDDEHGREPGREHARALGHATDA